MTEYDKKYPLTAPRKGGKGGATNIFEIGLITDLDKDAKFTTEAGATAWKSLLMKGTLTWDPTAKKVEVDVRPVEKAITFVSEFSRGGRGMELSELVVYNGKLYTVDDRTGIVFELADGKAIPWTILADGSGRENGGFKGEWMTMKDNKLYVGGHGKESIGRDGQTILNKNYQWIKIITKEVHFCFSYARAAHNVQSTAVLQDSGIEPSAVGALAWGLKQGAVTHENWTSQYDAMRAAAGCPYPGYLTHEAGVWSDKHKQWFFLPRKVSKEAYDYKKDERRAGNIMLRCSENFKDIQVVKIGDLKHNSRGFSTFKFIPGTEDTVILAIKSEEIDDAQRSFLFVFNIDGTVLLDDKEFSTTMKYEGIEFI